jgi:hypothetical protein
VGEILTSIRRYLWQHEYGRGPLFILCYWWFGNVGPTQHISMTMSYSLWLCHLWNFAHYFGYHEKAINGYALHFITIINV